jgi:hypothetical protein
MVIDMVRSPNLSEEELAHRLHRVYSLILSVAGEAEAAEGRKPGRAAPSVTGDVPDSDEPDAREVLCHDD